MAPAKRTKRSPNTSKASVAQGKAPSQPPKAPSDAAVPKKEDHASETRPDQSPSPDPLALLDEEDIPSDDHGGSTTTYGPAYAASGGYNALKSFHGQVYSGMAIGGSHTWNYDPGVWKETKEEPDLWRVDYQATKRRARNAPRGSGAPVGTEYHWLIVAHQTVKKVDANTYETHLRGSKYKLAHRAAASSSWSVPTVKAQREREVELLEDARRRVQGLPPVSAGEKVRVERQEKGQQKLDSLFAKAGGSGSRAPAGEGRKRKREE